MKRFAIAAAALAALAALVATLHTDDAAAVDPTPADTRGITVNGTASVSAVPDTAHLSFGVETRADTARAALAANATEMRKVVAAVRAAGGRELRTESVWLSSFHGEDGPQGFVASNSVSTEVAIGKAGALIDAAVAAGANQVSGPNMSVDERDELYRDALKAAVGDARERAEALAEAAGGSLGRITAVVESGAAPAPIAMERAAVASDAMTPIEPGRQEIAATVTVTFALA